MQCPTAKKRPFHSPINVDCFGTSALPTKTSSGHDGCAEQTSHLSQQQQWPSSSSSVSLSTLRTTHGKVSPISRASLVGLGWGASVCKRASNCRADILKYVCTVSTLFSEEMKLLLCLYYVGGGVTKAPQSVLSKGFWWISFPSSLSQICVTAGFEVSFFGRSFELKHFSDSSF